MLQRMKDQTLVCRQCGEDFVFSSGEQELQRIRGVQRAPTRCSICRSRPVSVPYLTKLPRD
jgi:Probable zinc-ribbon domain